MTNDKFYFQVKAIYQPSQKNEFFDIDLEKL
jgi:hypothetical protein